jgi:hypothetical protein
MTGVKTNDYCARERALLDIYRDNRRNSGNSLSIFAGADSDALEH